MTANANRKTETPSRGPLDSWLIPSICKKPRSPGQSPRKNASPRPIAHALPLRPPDPRRVLPSSPPTPPAPKPNKLTALTLKGELLVAAITTIATRSLLLLKLLNLVVEVIALALERVEFGHPVVELLDKRG